MAAQAQSSLPVDLTHTQYAVRRSAAATPLSHCFLTKESSALHQTKRSENDDKVLQVRVVSSKPKYYPGECRIETTAPGTTDRAGNRKDRHPLSCRDSAEPLLGLLHIALDDVQENWLEL